MIQLQCHRSSVSDTTFITSMAKVKVANVVIISRRCTRFQSRYTVFFLTLLDSSIYLTTYHILISEVDFRVSYYVQKQGFENIHAFRGYLCCVFSSTPLSTCLSIHYLFIHSSIYTHSNCTKTAEKVNFTPCKKIE